MNILVHFCGSHGVSLPAPIDVFEGMQIILVIYNFNRDCHVWFWNFKFMPMCCSRTSRKTFAFSDTSELGLGTPLKRGNMGSCLNCSGTKIASAILQGYNFLDLNLL